MAGRLVVAEVVRVGVLLLHAILASAVVGEPLKLCEAEGLVLVGLRADHRSTRLGLGDGEGSVRVADVVADACGDRGE